MQSLLIVRTGYLIALIRGVVRPEQALCLDNRYQPARRSIHACCAFQSVGIVLRTRSSRRSPAGWRPARMARWIVGDRNARRSNRRSYRGPGTDLINGAPERLCSIIACAVRSALMRTGSRRVAGTTAGLIIQRWHNVATERAFVEQVAVTPGLYRVERDDAADENWLVTPDYRRLARIAGSVRMTQPCLVAARVTEGVDGLRIERLGRGVLL